MARRRNAAVSFHILMSLVMTALCLPFSINSFTSASSLYNIYITHRPKGMSSVCHLKALFSPLLSASILITVSASAFTPRALAGPSLFYHYGQLKLSMQRCISKGYEVLDRRALYPPSSIEGERNFAVGENTNKMVIIDCSQVESTGRVTVMAASSNELNLSYARNIYNSLLY